MSENQWEKIRKAVDFSHAKLFRLLNENFKKCWQPGGVGSLDETIWPWKGKHEKTVFIERKPNPFGFKVLSLCFSSTRTNRPYCYHFIPELFASLSVADILNEFHGVYQCPHRFPSLLIVGLQIWGG
jgi:hypothetical protein